MAKPLVMTCRVLVVAAVTLAWVATASAGPLGRGINLGNALEAPTEGAWDIPATEAMFIDYAAAGFQNVRVPVRWDHHTTESAPYTVDPDWMERVEEVVDWGLNQGLYIILNMHHEEFIVNDWNKRERFYKIWEQISHHFRNKPDRLIFEIINEPANNSSLNNTQIQQLQDEALSRIRVENPIRDVMITGAHSPHHETVDDITLPPNDPHIIVTFHYYLPWSFIAGEGTWGNASDKQALVDHMDHVKKWSQQHDNMRIYMGEFGPSTLADRPSMLTYLDAIVRAATDRGFDFSIWEHAGDFEIYHQDTRTWDDQALGLVAPSPPERKEPP